MALCLFAGFTGFSSSKAHAAEAVGDARRVVNTVTGAIPAGKARNLGEQDPVYRNESISAAAASHGELALLDGSRIIVGEDSTISLDDFAVAGSSFSAGTIKVAKGAFRFISGGSSKEAIRIKTPLSTIGVRGTVVDVYVEPGSGVTHAVLISGRITACANNGKCLTTRRACDVLRIATPGQVEEAPFLHSAARTAQEENRLFSLTGANQQQFGTQWRAFEGACFARAAERASNTSISAPNNPQQGLSGPGTGGPGPDTDPDTDPGECGECGE